MGIKGIVPYPEQNRKGTDVRNLSGTARGILIVVREAWGRGEELRAVEIMGLVGIGKDDTYYRAIRELEQEGLIKRAARGRVIPLFPSTAVSQSDYPSIYRVPSPVPSERDEIDQHNNGATQPGSKNNGEILPPVVGVYREVTTPADRGMSIVIYPPDGDITSLRWGVTLREGCIRADEQDCTGTPQQRNSPYVQRLRIQKQVVQMTWAHFFPNERPLLLANAEIFLRRSNGSAEEVYERLELLVQIAEDKAEKGEPIESMLAYALKAFKNWAGFELEWSSSQEKAG